jgi:predicted TIM-barrel fold metal-dependent hydrolase
MFDLTTCSQKSIVLEAYEQCGAGRFTAGTDGPFATPTVKDAIVDDLTVNDGERQLILGGNLAKYLGIAKIPCDVT